MLLLLLKHTCLSATFYTPYALPDKSGNGMHGSLRNIIMNSSFRCSRQCVANADERSWLRTSVSRKKK